MSSSETDSDVLRLTEEHVEAVCLPGHGPDTCAFLTMHPGATPVGPGWKCAKGTVIAEMIYAKLSLGQMNATGDNCEGRE